MTISIIGASGEVGFRLVKKLQHAHKINGIVRSTTKKDFNEFDNVKIFQAEDISMTDKLVPALEGSDVVINAGYIWFAEDINRAINKMTSKPRHMIFTGSTGVFTKLPSDSAQKKRDAELYIKKNFNIP